MLQEKIYYHLHHPEFKSKEFLRATIPQLYPRVDNKNRGQAW
jgi:hypothetical protein